MFLLKSRAESLKLSDKFQMNQAEISAQWINCNSKGKTEYAESFDTFGSIQNFKLKTWHISFHFYVSHHFDCLASGISIRRGMSKREKGGRRPPALHAWVACLQGVEG
jgi:hypothetical protein